MRRALFDWHLILGYGCGALILVWSLSGAAMIMDPIVRRAFDPALPKAPLAALPLAEFSHPASRLPAAGASSVALRHFGGRSWYEARWADGRVASFDSRTGAPVAGDVTLEEARAAAAMAGGGRWKAGAPYRLDKHDDQYRSPAELPVIAVPLEGPAAPVLYFSVRDGSLLKTTTRLSRSLRWLGLGVHTWNAAAFKNNADNARRWGLFLLVALPLFTMAALSYWLLVLRNRALAAAAGISGNTAPAPRRATAALAAFSLLSAAPGEASVRAVGRVAMPVSAPGVHLPRTSASALAPSSVPGLSALSPSPSLAPAPAPLPSAATASPAAPLAAPAAAPRSPASRVLAGRAPAGASFAGGPAQAAASPDAPLEAQAAASAARFDAALPRPAFEGGSVLAAAADAPAPSGLSPAAPGLRKADRKALAGIYVTHAAHLLTLSTAWRVAWPLLALEIAGNAGLAAVGSIGALVAMGTGLAAGAIVDRFLPRRSMAAAAAIRAGVAVALALAAHGSGTPFLLGAFIAHSFALTAIHIGQSAAGPVAAGEEPGALRALNAKLKILTAAVSIPGSLAGGLLVASIGIPGALAAYAAANLLVLAPLYLWLFPRTAPAPSAARPQPAAGVASLWDAVKLVASNRVLLGALAAMAAGVALVEPLRSTTLPILASGLAPATAALLLGGFQAAFYVGQFAGNFGLLKWGKRLSDRGWLLVGSLGLAAFSLFLAASVHVAFGFAAAALIGLFSQPVSVVAKTIFQEEVRRVRPDLLGRAMGVNNVFYRLSTSAGTALVGFSVVAGSALLLGATGTLAAVYAALGVVLVASVLLLLKRPAPPAPPAPGADASRLHGAAFAGPMLAFSALDWHMTLGAFTGFIVLWMAATGAVTIAGPLLKKKLEPRLPQPPAQEGFAAHTLSLAQAEAALAAARPAFRPVSALARRGAGRAWYEFEDGSGSLAAVDGRTGALVDPFISAAEARSAFERWLAGSEWSVAAQPVLLNAYDEQYRKGEVPVYRVRLHGPGHFDAFVSARDGRPVEGLSRLSRVIRWAGIGMHTFGFGLLKSKYDSVRRVAMPLFVALPIILTVLFAMLWRYL